jgi:hypothetical protein
MEQIRIMYLAEYASGLDRFFETSWYTALTSLLGTTIFCVTSSIVSNASHRLRLAVVHTVSPLWKLASYGNSAAYLDLFPQIQLLHTLPLSYNAWL